MTPPHLRGQWQFHLSPEIGICGTLNGYALETGSALVHNPYIRTEIGTRLWYSEDIYLEGSLAFSGTLPGSGTTSTGQEVERHHLGAVLNARLGAELIPRLFRLHGGVEAGIHVVNVNIEEDSSSSGRHWEGGRSWMAGELGITVPLLGLRAFSRLGIEGVFDNQAENSGDFAYELGLSWMLEG